MGVRHHLRVITGGSPPDELDADQAFVDRLLRYASPVDPVHGFDPRHGERLCSRCGRDVSAHYAESELRLLDGNR